MKSFSFSGGVGQRCPWWRCRTCDGGSGSLFFNTVAARHRQMFSRDGHLWSGVYTLPLLSRTLRVFLSFMTLWISSRNKNNNIKITGDFINYQIFWFQLYKINNNNRKIKKQASLKEDASIYIIQSCLHKRFVSLKNSQTCSKNSLVFLWEK
jgi:hemolysin activation/secretion protein